MRLSNGIELEILKNDKVMFTKLIDGKLYKLSANCKTTKTLGLLVKGISSYTNDEFKNEAKATL